MRSALVNAAATYFGGMNPAGHAAKLPPPPAGRRGKSNWSADEVIAQIKDRKHRGLSLASARVPRMLRDAATYHLGGWREAIENAGIEYDDVRLKRGAYSRREVLTALRNLAKAQPNMALTQVHRHGIKSGIVPWFASVDEALRAAAQQLAASRSSTTHADRRPDAIADTRAARTETADAPHCDSS